MEYISFCLAYTHKDLFICNYDCSNLTLCFQSLLVLRIYQLYLTKMVAEQSEKNEREQTDRKKTIP